MKKQYMIGEKNGQKFVAHATRLDILDGAVEITKRSIAVIVRLASRLGERHRRSTPRRSPATPSGLRGGLRGLRRATWRR